MAQRETVTITQGSLRGLTEGNHLLWRGIPYAAPPMGGLRWRAPRPGPNWNGIRTATEFGPSALQPPQPGLDHSQPPSEDCLYLNVCAPAEPPPAGGRPVLVWLHAGGYLIGSGTMFGEGRAFADAGIVMVTLNYRLGALGFAHLGGIFGDVEADAGICGLLDQIAALRWVRDNIAAFGGDPRRVTIYGVSAGGKSVGNLLSSPAARGLFNQAIASSGGADHVATTETGTRLASRLLDELDRKDIHDLREIGGAEILAAQQRIRTGTEATWIWRPTIHPLVLPVVPTEAIARGSAAGVRLMAGNGGNEASTYPAMLGANGIEVATAPADDVLPAILGSEGAATLLETIGRSRGLDNVTDRKLAAMGDERYAIPTQRMADAQSTHGNVYRYRFDVTSPGYPPAVNGGHATEVPMVWHNTAATPGMTEPIDPARARLGDQLHQVWVNFVHTGVPSADGLPSWPRYDTTTRPVLILDDHSHIENDPRREERLAWGTASWPSGTWFPIPDGR
ncbi:MAG TPA: carboxylesterase family protein [Pseudonocardiaceae bacterium]